MEITNHQNHGSLRCDENKTELFNFLAAMIVKYIDTDDVVVVTKEEIVVSNQDIDITPITPCNHEEADTRVFLLVKHAAVCDTIQPINIISSDTDVVVTSISVF